MELALPILALGGLYVASNRENNNDTVSPNGPSSRSEATVEGIPEANSHFGTACCIFATSLSPGGWCT